MLFFENDYCEGAHPAILQRLLETNMEKLPGYGTDRYCESAREKIKGMRLPGGRCIFPDRGNPDQCHCYQRCFEPLRGSSGGKNRTYQCS